MTTLLLLALTLQQAPELPRVLVIGDSISMGYTPAVQELLQGKAEVLRIGENGGPTSNGVAKLDQWVGSSKWTVIHFNFGLHDLKIMEGGVRQVEPAEYEKNLRWVVARLKQNGAKLIFATTTPVPEGKVNPPRNAADVGVYNDIAVRVMKELDVEVNDLHGYAAPRLKELQRPVNVHFTDMGSRALGEQVAAAIERALGC